MARVTQLSSIKAHLESGNAITPLEALNTYGCFRLSAVIFNLKELGMNIETTMIKQNGKKFASYKKVDEAVA